MTPKRRNKHMVREAKHYQPEADEWPLKEFDFGDDENGISVFEQRRHDPVDGLQDAVKTDRSA